MSKTNEELRKKYIEMWDKGEFEWNHHEGDELGRKPISLERVWQIFIEPALTQQSTEAYERGVAAERKRMHLALMSTESHSHPGEAGLYKEWTDILQALTPLSDQEDKE